VVEEFLTIVFRLIDFELYEVEVMEYRSVGVLEYWSDEVLKKHGVLFFHYSTTPSLHYPDLLVFHYPTTPLPRFFLLLFLKFLSRCR
jgi:hypothetical protein